MVLHPTTLSVQSTLCSSATPSASTRDASELGRGGLTAPAAADTVVVGAPLTLPNVGIHARAEGLWRVARRHLRAAKPPGRKEFAASPRRATHVQYIADLMAKHCAHAVAARDEHVMQSLRRPLDAQHVDCVCTEREATHDIELRAFNLYMHARIDDGHVVSTLEAIGVMLKALSHA